jgi:hypothetical protein
MPSESGRVLCRRSLGRLAESGLLILAVALGVGAASSGFSLLCDAIRSGKETLASPEYRELVASARSSADEMTAPAIKQSDAPSVALTSADLDAARLSPAVAYSYAENREELSFIVGGMEEMKGFRVTPRFFDAWGMKAARGRLPEDSDAPGEADSVVLGSSAAARIAGGAAKTAGLVGKRLFTNKGYVRVVGVLAPSLNASYDESFFAPYEDQAAADGGPRLARALKTRLHFALADPSQLEGAERLLSGWFESRFGDGRIVVSSPRDDARKLVDRNEGLGFLILFLSMSGLFIALVNVSHILMSRGLRMRKNAGVMMALGASRSSLLKLFAGEAASISAAGSLLGGLFALPLSRSMQAALGLPGGSWLFAALGVAGSWLLALVFSLFPAWQNSRVVPAEAMRA